MANTSLRIKELARAKGMTLEDVAKRIGIRRTSLSQAMSRNSFSLEKLADIADALDCEIPDLFQSSQPSCMVCPHCGEPINITLS